MERGIDPAEAKAAPASKVDTVETLAAQFITRYAKPKNRSWQGTERLLALHVLPRWGKREAASITRRDVLDLMDALVDGGLPIGVNRVLAAVRKMFGWAVERDILPTSPVVNVRAPGRETERDRVLTDEELKSLGGCREERWRVGCVPQDAASDRATARRSVFDALGRPGSGGARLDPPM